MTTVALVAEGDTVVGHFRCSGTHLGRWLGKEPTGRRFIDVDEVYWFTVAAGRITAWWGLEDDNSRLKQLGLREPARDEAFAMLARAPWRMNIKLRDVARPIAAGSRTWRPEPRSGGSLDTPGSSP